MVVSSSSGDPRTATDHEPRVSCTNLSKSFRVDTKTTSILSEITLELKSDEFVVLFGPNGSGKTTLLNIIAGLDEDCDGTVRIQGKTPKDADVGYVFQNYNDALFPWKNVIANVALPLLVRGIDDSIAYSRAQETLERVGLGAFLHAPIYTLSGGQRQLVSICRAFVRKPDLLLFDEPCSALDYSTTKKIGLEIQSLWQQARIPALCVSHDIDESIFLADRIVVLSPRPGRIKARIEVPLPRPRTLDVFTSSEFFTLRKQVLEQFSYDQT